MTSHPRIRAGDVEVDRVPWPRPTPPASPGPPSSGTTSPSTPPRPLSCFPSSSSRTDPLTGALLAFSTYAVGYVSRPVGGIVFGRLGDRIGRKKVLVITLMIIGVATVLIGVLPGYASIGMTAPMILVLLRFAQGVGVGGEWGGAVLLSSEFGDPSSAGSGRRPPRSAHPPAT